MRSRRPRFLLRDAADISRLAVHLATHWKLPVVEVRIDRLPEVESQRTQDQFARHSAACNCIVGEALGGVTLLIGSCLACIWQSWRFMLLTLVATLAAALVGKGVEMAWNRASLVLVLRRLRNRVSDAIAGRLLDASTTTFPAARVYDYPLNSRNGDLPQLFDTARNGVSRGPNRPKLLVRDADDIDAAVRHLFARWTLPRIVVEIEGISAPDLERAQDRLVRLSGGYSHQFAGVLAFATFVVGMTFIMRPPKDTFLWTMDQDWSDFLIVLVATFLAAVIGHLGEVALTRVRLRRVLQGLRRQLSRST